MPPSTIDIHTTGLAAGRPNALLRLKGVAVGYGGKDVLHGVDLTLNAGEFRFLTGPVGAGKTSLLRVLGLSLPPTGGTMTIFNRELTRLDREEKANLRQKVGVIFQDFRLIEHMSAFDNVALPLRIGGADDGHIGRFVPEILAWLGLAAAADALPRHLSVGQRQLIGVARAVVTPTALAARRRADEQRRCRPRRPVDASVRGVAPARHRRRARHPRRRPAPPPPAPRVADRGRSPRRRGRRRGLRRTLMPSLDLPLEGSALGRLMRHVVGGARVHGRAGLRARRPRARASRRGRPTAARRHPGPAAGGGGRAAGADRRPRRRAGASAGGRPPSRPSATPNWTRSSAPAAATTRAPCRRRG